MEGDKEWTQKYVVDPRSKSKEASSSRSPPSRHQRSPIPRKPVPETPVNTSIPTPPASASPTSSNFHPSNPFSPEFKSASLLDTPVPAPGDSQRRSTPRIEVSKASTGTTTSKSPSHRRPHPSDYPAGPSARPRSSSARAAATEADSSSSRRRSASNNNTHNRNSSLSQRFAGDMSHRPLDQIKRETKVANRAGKHRRGPSQPDTIDALDTIGGSYHHDGPYEATLASRNVHSKYSPVAAVRESNMEALRATPREYLQDSLQRHVPLQGTSSVPNGNVDLSGNVMTYEEGADLMRERDAEGGAYKRYDDMRYHPDDLKGKGEPSFTYERDAKAKESERLLRPDQRPDDVELMAGGPGRHRSLSNGAYEATATGMSHYPGGAGGVHRSNTTGKRLSDGLKRRWGSLRKRKDMPAEQVH